MRELVVVGIAAVVGAVAIARAAAGAITWDFGAEAPGAAPNGFSFGRTGQGREGRWVVVADPTSPAGGRALAQLDDDATDYRFPVAVAEAPVLRDLRLEVRCRPLSGKVDEACGLVFRFRDADDYYVARANALEDNVNLYRVVKGRRSQIAGWRGAVTRDAWHALAVEARGDHLKVFWDGRPVVDARDATFPEAGRVGVWTKADSVTHFAALTAVPL
jgi:hypothetical protein